MDEFAERLANLASLSNEELQELLDEMSAKFDELDSSGASISELNDFADSIDSVREEQETRVAQESDREELRNRVHLQNKENADTETVPEEEKDEEEEKEEEPEEEEKEESSTKDVVAASGTKRPSLSNVREKANKNRAPVPMKNNKVKTTLVAAGDIAGFSAGQEINSVADLSNAMVRKLQALGHGSNPGTGLVASLLLDYPEERQLGEDPVINDAKMEAIAGESALIASGGICQPLAVDYGIDVIGSTARPLQASLPSFQATRGGVRFTPPPVLSGITPPETWTVADDVSGSATKTCFTVVCGTPVEAMIYGIPVCIQVGNMMGKFSPEMVAAQTKLLDVATARMAELELINIIDAGSIAVTSTGVLGTIRTVLPTIDLLAAGYRYRYRLDQATKLRMVLPAWVKEEVRSDISMELAHDDGESLGVTDAQINAYFNNRNVNIVWTLEDKANSFGGAQGAGAIKPWPATFVAYVYAEGTWQFLDGGRIDLGVVRDSVLNSKNDYQIWREDFEGLAKRGNESLKVTVTAKPTGMSAGTKDTSV